MFDYLQLLAALFTWQINCQCEIAHRRAVYARINHFGLFAKISVKTVIFRYQDARFESLTLSSTVFCVIARCHLPIALFASFPPSQFLAAMSTCRSNVNDDVKVEGVVVHSRVPTLAATQDSDNRFTKDEAPDRHDIAQVKHPQ